MVLAVRETGRMTEKTWTTINQPIHDRVENRIQNTRFLKDSDAIVKRAETLLSSKTFTWADLAVGKAPASDSRSSFYAKGTEDAKIKRQGLTAQTVILPNVGPMKHKRQGSKASGSQPAKEYR